MIPIAVDGRDRGSFIGFCNLGTPLVFGNEGVPMGFRPSGSMLSRVGGVEPVSGAHVVIRLTEFGSMGQRSVVTHVSRQLFGRKCSFYILVVKLASGARLGTIGRISSPIICVLKRQRGPLRCLTTTSTFTLYSVRRNLPVSLVRTLNIKAVPVYAPIKNVMSIVGDNRGNFLSGSLSRRSCCRMLGLFLRARRRQLSIVGDGMQGDCDPFGVMGYSYRCRGLCEKVVCRGWRSGSSFC